MISLPGKFSDENLAGINSPSVIVDLQEEVLEVEEALQVDWAANTGESNVDYATQPGDVILADVAYKLESYDTGGSDEVSGVGGQPHGQSFTVPENRNYHKLSLYLDNSIASGTSYITIREGGANPEAGTLLYTSPSFAFTTSLVWYDFIFDVSMSTGTTYWICIYPVSGGGTFAAMGFGKTGSSPYANGKHMAYSAGWVELYPGGADIYFRMYADKFDTSGYIDTDEMDVGSIPSNNGEWSLSDLTPDDSTLTYTAWASATGAFGGEEDSLGTIVDGGPITNLKRYYKVKATFAPNIDRQQSPTLQSIKASFTEYVTYSDNPDLGFKVALKGISALTTTIDTFKSSTVGQMSLTFDHILSLSDWVNTKYPKNKDVIIYAGFRGDGWTKQDHIQFFHGQIDEWSVNAQNQLVIIIKDFSKEWAVDVPTKWESAGDDVTWTAQHHIDVMLDILQNQINVRDSKIELDSFATVKAALSGWEVTRTITGEAEDGKKLMEELRILCSAFFVPNANGSIGIKRFDPTEDEIDSLTDDDFIGVPSWEANAGSLINRALIYTNWDGDGDSAADFSDVDISTDATSQTNHSEIATYELKDKWTRTAQKTVQITNGIAFDILDRFADPPSILNVVVDRKKIYYEPGDIIKITTINAPSSDGNGIADVKFQIVNKNLDFLRDRIKLKLLEV